MSQFNRSETNRDGFLRQDTRVNHSLRVLILADLLYDDILDLL